MFSTTKQMALPGKAQRQTGHSLSAPALLQRAPGSGGGGREANSCQLRSQNQEGIWLREMEPGSSRVLQRPSKHHPKPPRTAWLPSPPPKQERKHTKSFTPESVSAAPNGRKPPHSVVREVQ